MRAAKLLDRGISQAETARQVKVSRQSVHRWALQILKQGGADGLKRAGRAGRRPRLGARELKRLESILREGPEKAGFPNGLWTLDRIAWIIKEQFGVKYHTAQVWRILRQKLGWSCQRPIGRACERNEAAIRDWKENIWPALKKKPKKRAASSSS
jgi:transposase